MKKIVFTPSVYSAKIFGKIVPKYYFKGSYTLWKLVNNKRISIERLAGMQLAYDYYNRKIKDLDHIGFYFENYKYFFQNYDNRKEMSYYRVGKTFEKTLQLNKKNIQLYQETDPKGCIRRLDSVG